MIYFLHSFLVELYSGFNVVKYITFRAVACAVTSFIICVLLGPPVIRKLKMSNLTDNKEDSELNRRRDALFSENTEKSGFKEQTDFTKSLKKGVPAMGGVIISASVILSSLFWVDISNKFFQIVLFVFVSLSFVGLYDDLSKLRLKNGGVAGRHKLFWQSAAAVAVGLWLFYRGADIAALWNAELAEGGNYRDFIDKGLATVLAFPFVKNFFLDLGWLYPVFAALVIIGASNAVNLTDGLDGLAAGCMTFVAIVYTVFAYVAGNWQLSSYLGFLFIEGSGELAVFCSALAGACLGFLWFNAYPAQIFMGDTGSLSLGGAIGAVAVIIKQEILLIIAGGIFVVEALSVILQVGSFKLTNKRLFKIAPLHHHFECKGVFEPKIIMRFMIVAAILALISLGTLKMR
jgi:phospho-N-acetylmuramoyl-pentapeptide-transferase